jgi:hypothetical protein
MRLVAPFATFIVTHRAPLRSLRVQIWRRQYIDIQPRQEISRQHSVPRGTAYRARFGFRSDLRSTACTKSGHVSQSPRLPELLMNDEGAKIRDEAVGV